MKNLIAFSVLVSSVAISAAHAQVHRCTEAPGHVTYSDLPCANGQPGTLIESQNSADIGQERLTANAAAEKSTAFRQLRQFRKIRDPNFQLDQTLPHLLQQLRLAKVPRKSLSLYQASEQLLKMRSACG